MHGYEYTLSPTGVSLVYFVRHCCVPDMYSDIVRLCGCCTSGTSSDTREGKSPRNECMLRSKNASRFGKITSGCVRRRAEASEALGDIYLSSQAPVARALGD